MESKMDLNDVGQRELLLRQAPEGLMPGTCDVEGSRRTLLALSEHLRSVAIDPTGNVEENFLLPDGQIVFIRCWPTGKEEDR